MSVVFLDNFNRANSSTVGNGWSQGNSISINSNRLVTPEYSQGDIWRTIPEGANLDISAVPYGGAARLYLTGNGRQVGGTSGYFALISQGSALLYRINAGSFTTLANIATAGVTSTPKTFRLTVTSTQVILYDGTTAIITVTDSVISRSIILGTGAIVEAGYTYDGEGEIESSSPCYLDDFTIYGAATTPTFRRRHRLAMSGV